ncbi:hypothetical protein [Paraburkholderia sp. BCC1885]|uniref:hypothetical protein n=1 Tax=Paraburkholderia sp. BCC1885 TaxID=2562669 RepID=UPI0011835BE5|nr:hypothetical protein [Paraburkholderia sp. BCC1885]
MIETTENIDLAHNALDQATEHASKETTRMIRESVGVVSVGIALMLVYAMLKELNSPVAIGGCERMNSLVREATTAGYLNFLTIDALLVSLAMLSNGSFFSRNLLQWACQPLLKLFIHSGSFALGISMGYMLLTIPDVTQKATLPSVIAFGFLVLFMVVFSSTLYFLLHWVKREILVVRTTKVLKRNFPSWAAEKVSKRSELIVGLAGVLAAFFLAVAAWQQLGVDMPLIHHAETHASDFFKCN